MDIITQDAYHRQRMLKYFGNHTATETTIRYNVSRKTLYKRANRYDGTLESLKDMSRKPHNSPNGQTADELNLVKKNLEQGRAATNSRRGATPAKRLRTVLSDVFANDSRIRRSETAQKTEETEALQTRRLSGAENSD